MNFRNIDKIIENVLREQLLIEGTNQRKLRARAVKALIDRGVDAAEAKKWEETFFDAHFHAAHDRLVRLEAFFAGAAASVGFDEGKVNRLIDILDLIKRNWQKDGFYDIGQLKAENPSNYEYDTLNKIFGSMVDEEKQNDETLANSQGGSMTDGYSVKNVTSFGEAREIGNYSCPGSKLCFTTDKSTWNSYTKNGVNECYVILRDGWKDMKSNDYVNDPNRPFDDYGLSMIFLFIKPNGEIATSNTRWNHSTGGKYQGDVDQSFTKGDIAKLLGVNFDAVFKPGKSFEEKLDIAMHRLANGEDPRNVFNVCEDFSEGFSAVKLLEKWNYINTNGELLSPNQWFDECGDFNHGFGRIILDDKYNFIKQNGKLLSPNQWFDSCLDFKEGFAQVNLKGKYNFINTNGEILSPNQWFVDCWNFDEGCAAVQVNGKGWNYINQNGGFLSPNQWFDCCRPFKDGFGRIDMNDKQNYINANGDIVFPNQWFDECFDFSEGFAVVRVDYLMNFIDTNGEPISDRWFEECYAFKDGFAPIRMFDKENFINTNGEIIYKPNDGSEWFDFCERFTNGLAKVRKDYSFNLLKPNGELVSPNIWFDSCTNLNDGFYDVELNGKYNFVNRNGVILYKPNEPEEWFDDTNGFYNGFANVRKNGKWNYLKLNGELVSPNQWFDECCPFHDGFAEVTLNNNEDFYIDEHGNLYRERPQVAESRILTKIISESIRMSLRRLI